MTYTFKLARRLAVSRDFAVLTAFLLLAACNGDTTAPGSEPSGTPSTTSLLRVSPRSITVETNQPVGFRGQLRSSKGEIITIPVAWGATGGTISADGIFSSSLAGTFKVIGRGRGWKQTDTSVVVVVPPATNLVSLAISPNPAIVNAGASRAFTVLGLLSDSTTATIGVTWSATGGKVDAAGVYTADSVGGTYRVIATNTAGTMADTAVVTVNPPSAPAPTLASVTLRPASVSFTAGGSQQFRAYGLNSIGDSVAVSVTFSATGGTVSTSGLYTAGQTAGTYRVVAAASGKADTSVVTLASPPPPPTSTGRMGVPFGAFNLFSGSTLIGSAQALTLTHDGYASSNLIDRINAARSGNTHLLLALTGGSHNNYLTNGVFDPAKWGAKLATFNTSAIRQAVAAAVADGTIIGASVMDEPQANGTGADGNTWGPAGTLTKVRVDSLCGAVKAVFPTLPVGVVHQWNVFESTKDYRVCDFIDSQYSARVGDVTTYRDAALALGRRSGHAIMFGLNILNGGIQDKDGTYDCSGTGGLGQSAPNCRMTADQVRQWGLTLGQAGCALLMWRYDATFMGRSDNQQAFKDIETRLAGMAAPSCRRS